MEPRHLDVWGVVLFIQVVETVEHMGGNTLIKVGFIGLDKFLARDVLKQLDIAVRYALAEFGCHLGHFLTWLAHEAMLNKPLAYKLF